MVKFAAALALASAATAFAAPAVGTIPHQLIKRNDNSSGLTDADILNFALTLEHLENAFYKEGIANYTDFSASNLGASVKANIAQIGADEANHVALLTSALSAAGATPVEACTYSFPATDASSFLALSQVLEGVGIAAYIGAARYISDPDYLTVAAEILTIEARHNAYIRLANSYSSFPSPYDTALTPKAIVSLAGSFFVSCPDGSAPAIQPFPAAVVSTTNYTLGSTISVAVNSSLIPTDGEVYCAFASGVTAGFSSYSNGSCEIPTTNVTGGQIYGLITSAMNISDASTIAGPFILNIDTANNTVLGAAKQTTSESGAVAIKTAGLVALTGLVAALFA